MSLGKFSFVVPSDVQAKVLAQVPAIDHLFCGRVCTKSKCFCNASSCCLARGSLPTPYYAFFAFYCYSIPFSSQSYTLHQIVLVHPSSSDYHRIFHTCDCDNFSTILLQFLASFCWSIGEESLTKAEAFSIRLPSGHVGRAKA